MDKLRLRFKKTGRAIYISHLDLMKTMQRAFSRAEYELKYSEGFNPRPQISIALPLSVGTGSVCEVMDFKLRCETALDDFPQRLTAAMPEGIEIIEVYEPQRKASEIKWLEVEGVMEYDERDAGEMAAALREFYAAPEIVITKKTKRGQKTLELKNYLDRIAYTVEGDTVRFTAMLPCGSGEALSLNPSLLTDFLRTQGAAPVWQCRVLRTHLYNKAGKDFE